MDLRRAAICLKFRPNQFNRNRCQNCFRSSDAHTDEALQASKRWQRRWFALHDDGELSFALDQHADTVPQGVVDMTAVTEVKEADDLTGHSHSLRVTTQSNDNYYFKADTAEEIKWWRDLLCIYSKQLVRRKMRLNNLSNGEQQDPRQEGFAGIDQANGGPTLVQVKNSLIRDRSQRRISDPFSQAKVDVTRSNESSFHGTPRSVKNRKTTRYRDDARSKTFSEFDTSGIYVEDNPSVREQSTVSRVSEDDEEEDAPPTNDASSSWTVRLRTAKTVSLTNDSKTISSALQDRDASETAIGQPRPTSERSEQNRKETSAAHSAQTSELPVANGRTGTSESALTPGDKANEENEDKDHGASLTHTLRKGWLMLKGRSDNDWSKHWVVLAGLSLKMYKDAWAEDGSSDATVKIDLTDCSSVHTLSAARNYGIEIKCKHARYVLSALTPGIRDSWIAAMQQNLAASALESSNRASCANPVYRQDEAKKKRIAYVTPESHRRDASCDTDGDEEDEEDIESFRSSSRADEASVSGRSAESSNHDPQSDDGETTTYSGTSTPRRRRSLSPTVRRSPVSRVKERDTSRRQRSPAQLRARSPSDNRSSTPSLATSSAAAGGPVLVHSEVIFDARNLSSESARVEANVIAMLQSQLETVRQELERTRRRLSETENENERLRVVTNGDDREVSRNGVVASAIGSATVGESEADLARLRKTLQEAERDIWSKQEEIEVLTRKLDCSVNELSDTETVLSSSLHDLDSERAKFSSLSEDWSRRVSAMEKQLRETIRRLDERERELMNERSSDQQKAKEQQRRRAGTAERNENTIAQLESKLAESEANVAALSRKLQELESTSNRVNGGTAQSASSSALLKAEDQEDGSKKVVVNDDGENEIRFDSLRHYCHDQNRRLLATLRNETEFMQTMVETKLTVVSSTSGSRASIAAELKELSDDLIAVHQYISEIDRHLQPSDKSSSPNDFVRDFNFKDVLNRLVEVQERFASLTKRDDAMSMVSEAATTVRIENGDAMEAARVPDSLHDSHEGAESSNSRGPAPFPLSSTNQTLEPAVPFSTYWNYSVSVLHADLARSLASYLERKYNESTKCTVLTSADFRTILTETMALEACLLTEIANVIEASKNEERLRMAVKLRDVRNAYVVLRRLDDFLNDAGDDRRMLAILEHRLDVNFFNILCEEAKHFVAAHLKELIAALPSNWREKLEFGPADSDARVAALKALSKNLLRDLVVFESNSEETTSCSMELLRSTVLKDEITHILSRVETSLDAFDASSSSYDWNGSDTGSVIAEAAHSTISLCDQLIDKIDGLVANLIGTEGGSRDFEEEEYEKAAEVLKSRLADFLKRLKQSSSSNGAAPLNAASAKMAHIDGAVLTEIGEVGSSIQVRSSSDLPTLASLISAKAVVRGYRSWIEAAYGKDLSLFKTTPKKAFDFHQCSTELEFQKFLVSGSKLAECVAHYEPLTKQLFYSILSNIGTKLVAVQLSVFYECRMRDMAAAQESVLYRALQDQQCEWCGNRKSAGRNDEMVPGGHFVQDEPGSFAGCSAPRLRSKEELEHWRRLAPSDGSSGAPTNLAGEVAELEQEILEMQSYHNEELEALRSAHAAEAEALRRELATEQERRRKLYSDMESMKTVTDHSLATLERAHSQLLDEIRDGHHREVQRLAREYERSLKEEKEATRQALDALQKAHQMELHKQAEKLKNMMSGRYSNGNDDDGSSQHSRHDLQEALQEISKELSDVSAAYSAKCLEKSRMEDELEDAKRILDQMASGSAVSDEQIKQQLNAIFHRSAQINTLHTELASRDAEIRRHEERIRQLESELTQTQNVLASVVQGERESSVGAAAAAPESSTLPSVPAQNGHGDHLSYSSASSDELDEDDGEDDIAAEYQPKTARRRRPLPHNRRGDSRYHSTPNLGAQDLADTSNQQSGQHLASALTPDRILQELRNVMGLPVSERRKYFENLCKPTV